MPWTRWLRPTAWLLTWRNIDDFVEETGSSPPEVQQRTGQPLAVGLAATVAGGEVLFVEARTVPGRGRLRVTGALGPLATESALVALTWP